MIKRTGKITKYNVREIEKLLQRKSMNYSNKNFFPLHWEKEIV